MAAYVPIDLHRHRSVVMHMADDGEVLGWTRLANDPETLVAEVLKSGEAPEVAIEATYGWYWAVDALQAAGANVHLVAPSKLSAFEGRRVKNDQRDCHVLGDLMRAKMLPEAWISTPQVREWRELVRYWAKLVGMRSGLKAQAHAVLAKHGMGCRCRICSVSAAVRCSPTCANPTPASTPPTGNASSHSSCLSTP